MKIVLGRQTEQADLHAPKWWGLRLERLPQSDKDLCGLEPGNWV